MDDESPQPGTLLVLSQVFVPDPASVGQHMGRRAYDVVRSQLTQELLCGRLCDVLERGALLEGSRRAALHHPIA